MPAMCEGQTILRLRGAAETAAPETDRLARRPAGKGDAHDAFAVEKSHP